ncbi:addiction module toxin RelE [Acidiphilium sp. AL]|uniref:Addiction module toxin RelE n=1 Tax=Acidiphilium iwatense TaxID=768198 RepID=A0ABS9DS49_9PROT|nr:MULTISPECIES: addiction module toxin RelE [Acidiphilium]MCF3945556.1 addiction module toxin RelE [Acidiphilium iwatense]MCU4159639.1 addiction module toxin RelE [Acidiphilium sp. AL]
MEADIAAIETELAAHPQAGDMIPGLAGIRKLRFRLGNRGKRGGGRAIYFLMLSDDTALMLFAYAKNEREDMTQEQRAAALEILKEMRDGDGE